ncbi:AbrB family transcriptional regulator [Planococcus salinus]|uniref:AbrB family transcriptional regulator n=1 Tax=Planococcus salinus TaxID=1848460 RepID=A0A3M8P5Z7_9BACL|nr:AbrB family transcriptional regulator [Planococcus salinus]RNF39032.1 AbrB family transcriptional regulator [Planococcus salinus]
MNFIQMGKAFAAGLAGAFLFTVIGAPMPWLLGPLFAVLLIQLFTPISLKWHTRFRNVGLVIAGYVIGFAFTLEAIQGMKQYFLPMLVVNIAFFLLFIVISYLMASRTKVDYGTALTCCVPGGLSQIITFAEEQKGIDLTAVTFYHVLRVLMIVAIVPFMVASGGSPHVEEPVESHYSFYLIVLLVICYGSGSLFKKFHVPTAHLLGPVFLIMCLNLVNVEVPVLPSSLLHVAQIFIGIYIGLLLRKENIKLTPRLIFYSFFSGALLIAFAFGLSFVLQSQYGLSFSTSFLSLVPGGLDQMGIIAASVHADVTVVTAFQLFRILFLSVFIVPLVKVVIRRRQKAAEAL